MELVEVMPGSFIYTIDDSISKKDCQFIIDSFNDYPNLQKQGYTLGGYDSDMKDTKDISVHEGVSIGLQEFQDIDEILFQSLTTALQSISAQFDHDRGFHMDEGYLLQHYQCDGKYDWHTDENPLPNRHLHRRLTALWYLNTLKDDQGGGTLFFDQQLEVRPKAGTLLLFPACWTHKHKGDVVNYGDKYIATTWIGTE